MPVTWSVWNSSSGTGATTRNVAWTVWPLSTAPNVVGDVACTVQPCGADRPSLTCWAASTPLSVNVSVAVPGSPAVSADRPLTSSVTFGGATVGLSTGETRYMTVLCGSTSALITPAV